MTGGLKFEGAMEMLFTICWSSESLTRKHGIQPLGGFTASALKAPKIETFEDPQLGRERAIPKLEAFKMLIHDPNRVKLIIGRAWGIPSQNCFTIWTRKFTCFINCFG